MKIMFHELIEELRIKMHEIASDKDLTDPKVVRVSERLDILINAYYLLTNKRHGLLATGGNDYLAYSQHNPR